MSLWLIRFIKWLLIVALVSAGLFVSARGAIDTYGAYRASGWPKVEGTVVSAKTIKDDHGSQSIYSPSIVYEYNVGNKRYVSSMVKEGRIISHSKSCIDVFLKKYIKGNKCVVFINPADTNYSLLMVGVTSDELIPLSVGIFLLLLGLSLHFIFKRLFE